MGFFKRSFKTVFIVEDDKWCSQIFEALLKSLGNYNVLTFINAKDALKSDQLPDLIISDLYDEDMVKNDIYRLKSFKAPILLLSSNMSVQLAKDYLDEGFDVCLPKKIISMDRECFLNCVTDLLNKKSNKELNRSRSFSSYMLNSLDDIGIALSEV